MADHQPFVVEQSQDEDEARSESRVPMEKAQEFLSECGSDIHPIFDDTKSNRQEQSNVATSHCFSPLAKLEAAKFLEVMETHKSLSNDYSTRLLDLRAEHSWDDMMVAALDAEKAYEAAGLLRKAGRFISARAEITAPLLRLIPNGFTTSIFYGGLRLVFDAMVQLDERRLKVLGSFLRIPNIIMLAEDCVRNFPSDGLLYERAEEVFCAALPAIEGAISWLKQNPAKKQFRALVLGPRYNKNFKGKVQALDDALDKLHERVSVLRDRSITRTATTVDNVHTILNRADTKMSTMNEDLKNIAKYQNETHEKVDNLNDLEKFKEDARQAIKIVLEQKIVTSEWMAKKDRAIRRLERQVKALEEAGVALTRDDLLEILNVNANFAIEDLRRVQRACQSQELVEFQITQGIIEGKKMSEWVNTDAASALFIEGTSSCDLGRNTSLSFLSSEVIESFRDKRPAEPIFYFCGLHTSVKDPMRGPTGIMRSLIWQVLSLHAFQFDFMSRRNREQLEVLNLHALCDCFCKLVKRLPINTIIVCVIDSISFFEKKEWSNDCRHIMGELQSLLDNDVDYPVFKLLVTSPVRSRYVGSTFSDDSRVTLAGDGSCNTRHGPTERELAIAGTRPMRSALDRRRRFVTSLRNRRHLYEAPIKEAEVSESESLGSDWDKSVSATEMEIDVDEMDHQVVVQSPSEIDPQL